MTAAAEKRRRVGAGNYLFFLAIFAVPMFCSHLWAVKLPFFWDEAGQFVPAALDLFRTGAWIPHSVMPNVHPPGVMAYLAAVWHLTGFSVTATRCAMLLLASLVLLSAFLLAIELSREGPGRPAFLATALLFLCPLFYAQSLLAQLDLPAMLLTTLALLAFLQGHIRVSAAICASLVLVKETGIVAPLVFGGVLIAERRWRDALWFLTPCAALAGWLLILANAAGYWMGNHEFAVYNLFDALHPARIGMALLRRLYYLFAANFHWVGTAVMVVAWRKRGLYTSRAWKIAGILAAAHIVAVSALGGAVLERYLLPVLPILYAAMAAALSAVDNRVRIAGSLMMVAGLAAGNWINPPYPAPLEDNLAFADFLSLQTDVAQYLQLWHPRAVVSTVWPLTVELENPDLGFVRRPLRTRTLPNFSTDTLGSMDWTDVRVMVAFARGWEPERSLLDFAPITKLRERYYNFVPHSSSEDIRQRVPLTVEAHFERRGQWVDIYANPPRLVN